MLLRTTLLLLLPGLSGCAEAIWRVDTAMPPPHVARDPRVQRWQGPLEITYTFWTSGRVTSDVSPVHQWWRHAYTTGWEVDATEGTNGYSTIRFDGVDERYQRRYPQGRAVMFLVPAASQSPP